MDSSTKNIFQQFLMEEFEKQMEKRQGNVVEAKRKEFDVLLTKAHDELRNKSYTEASKNYYRIVNLLRNDPYPDEFQLSREMEFAIKSCFCYSSLKSVERFKDEEVNSVLLDVIKELNDNFRTRLFPMYLLVLLNFHRKQWLATLTWCDEVSKYVDETENNQDTEIFKELLPTPSEVRFEAEMFEEIAFFGYGEKISRNTLLKPRLEKYKDWVCNFNDFIADKIMKLRSPVSEVDLHIVFHKDIFPIWCMTNNTEYESFYNDKFSTECPLCMRAKLQNAILDKNENVMADKEKFEKYVEHCAQFYQKFAVDFAFEMDETNEKPKNEKRLDVKTRKSNNTPAKKSKTSTVTQTEKIKTNNKYVQTDAKNKNTENQPITDPQVLGALSDIKNKLLANQEKKDDTIAKLTKKINELHDKISKENNTKKITENDFDKKTTSFKSEIQKLKEKLADSEKKYKAENEKNICLQKLLMEQINDKYNMHKERYKMCHEQARFMITYLNDLVKFLTAKSLPNDATCMTHIGIWEKKLKVLQQDLEQFNAFYQNVRSDMMNLGKYEIIWPDPPELPKFDDNLIFNTFKGAIRNIIQTEEQLYWKYAQNYQSQMQRAGPPVMPLPSYTYYAPRPQFPQQNKGLAGPSLVYPNSSAPTVPEQFRQQQLMQFRQQQLQSQKNEQIPPKPFPMPPSNVGLAGNNPRMSRSVEFLDRAVGGPSPMQQPAIEGNSLNEASATAKDDKKETILLDYVLEQCPGSSEEEVTLALLRLLEDNKGTLSEIPKEQIVKDVKFILRMKKQAAWVTPKSPHVDWHNDHLENECAICFEDFTSSDKYTLDCQHDFHKECIKKWLKMSSVCPICRIHSVIDEEYPPLH